MLNIMNGMAPVDEKEFNLEPDINLYEEFTDLLFNPENRDKTKAFLDEVSKEANTIASFFGRYQGVLYARARIVEGRDKKDAAWRAVDGRGPSGRSFVNYNSFSRRNNYDE